jgi:hypothetical protein
VSYLEELHAAHKRRVVSLSRPQPHAKPPRPRPQVRVIPIDRDGRQVAPPPPPAPVHDNKIQALIEEATKPLFLGDGRIGIDSILRLVAKKYQCKVASIRLRDVPGARMSGMVRPRHVAMLLAKEFSGRSLPEIGRRLGGFDHTTVLYAISKMSRLETEDQKLAATLQELRFEIETLRGQQ